jgi:hypothetical protein
LHLLAEGGKDARGRVRITTVLVTPPPDDDAPAAAGRPGNGASAAFGASDAPDAASGQPGTAPNGRDTHTNGSPSGATRRDGTGAPAGRREETDVRPG